MTCLKNTTCILLLITTPLLSTAAQNAPSKKSSTEQAASERAQQKSPAPRKGTGVLDQVLEAQKSFVDENVRVAIQAHSADHATNLLVQSAVLI